MVQFLQHAQPEPLLAYIYKHGKTQTLYEFCQFLECQKTRDLQYTVSMLTQNLLDSCQ